MIQLCIYIYIYIYIYDLLDAFHIYFAKTEIMYDLTQFR